MVLLRETFIFTIQTPRGNVQNFFDFFYYKKMIQDEFRNDLLTCLIMESSRVKPLLTSFYPLNLPTA